MGNCMNKMSRKQKQHERRRHGERVAPEERDREEEGLQVMRIAQVLQEEKEVKEEDVPATAGVKVKVVLTRAELEWLMAQLKSGEQRLEDVLHQMGTARADHKPPPPHRDGWRPRLECILECSDATAGAVEAT